VSETDLLRAGQVGSPHGLDGSFHVIEPVSSLLVVGEPVKLGEEWHLVTRRAGHERRVILRVEGCEDRTAAVALRGTPLMVGRGAAPPLEADEWWAEDLEGCAVHDGATEIGVVRRLRALPSCEVLEVERPGGAELLVPLVADAVRAVDVERRRIDIDLVFLGEAP
jgi:16S rRNA processing protein RimM